MRIDLPRRLRIAGAPARRGGALLSLAAALLAVSGCATSNLRVEPPSPTPAPTAPPTATTRPTATLPPTLDQRAAHRLAHGRDPARRHARAPPRRSMAHSTRTKPWSRWSRKSAPPWSR